MSQQQDTSRKRRRSPTRGTLGQGPLDASSPADGPSGAGLGALAASTPGALSNRSSPPPSSLPPSSPPGAGFSDFASDADEANEEDVIDEENDARALGDDEDDEEGEDLFAEGMEDDYNGNAALDAYDPKDIDDDVSVDEMDPQARRVAELKMARRDRQERAAAGAGARRSRAPAFLQSDDEDEDRDVVGGGRRRRHYDERMEEEFDVGAEDLPLEQLGDVKTDSIASWVATENVRRTIEREFRNFLVTYVDDNGVSVYGQRIKVLGELNSESLEVSFLHLVDSKAILAYFLANSPAAMLPIFDQVAFDVIMLYYPHYDRIHPEIHVRISDLPTSSTLRDLRQEHLNSLVRVSGVVTRRTGVFPQLKYVKFDCLSCGAVLGPFFQDANQEVKVSYCNNCSKRGPFQVNSEQTVYRNYQKMTLQESPGSVPPGRLPRHREVILLWDLIDSAKPGEEVEVTGIYRNNFDAALNTKNGFPVFATVLEANHIAKRDDAYAAFRMTEEDERAVRALARDERIGRRILKSVAPSIYGHEDIKTAIALSLFGGCAKDVGGKHRIRGDINVLLLGDPGTAKSQFLKYVEKTASRAVFTTGQGASAVGLTASVRKDPVTHEWTLEGGALVLADKGVCLIDEFDKMNDADRTSIHEAMEQQSISISKAGIVTTLQARCAILAAANPTRGRYNPTIPFAQNVELTEPILSRFDVLCVVKDTVDPVKDDMLARFVVGSHLRSHPRFDEDVDESRVATSLDADIIPQDLLRKYIMYARAHVRPKLHSLDQDRMARLYADLRRESLSTGSYPITVRHLESMIRMAEASAKMHLRDYVRADDIDLAIRTTVESFVSAQKMSIKRTLERGFRKYLHSSRDHDELLAFLLGGLVKDRMRFAAVAHRRRHPEEAQAEMVSVPLNALESKAKELNIFDVRPFLNSRLFQANGYAFDEQQRAVTKRFGAVSRGAEQL
ncbi:dna replication licensing factor cdc19 (cell division control protein 19) [Ceraceosorus bombacis]|uniref:DNA replication licensing factor MCM2 n=1 Tax=Ceraceosorus bombacis TaxID=401625 RepID=A0A0P1BH63_9BASI|nr:dna replication licensing factor cdc19 (cell division control protein 19) [Ceraceosorus bombacis]